MTHEPTDEEREFIRALHRTDEPESETELTEEQTFIRSLFRHSN